MLINTPLPRWLESVHHDGSPLYAAPTYPRLGEAVTIRLRHDVAAPVRGVYLRLFPDGEQTYVAMEPAGDHGPARWWTARLPINEPSAHYRFVLEADDGVWWFTAAGPAGYGPLDNTDFRILADYEAPAWVQDAVFYQIFPDRFDNADPATDPRPDEFEYRGRRPQTYPWGTLPPEDQFNPLTFYGGDLPGITRRLDYLTELGITALYLNPIFSAHSNHKYDVADYDHVDPHFGGDAALVALRAALSERSMRYLLDIVPNHCGYWHPWFAAARADAAAPEAAFFTFRQHPDEYESWLGVWSLPKLNYNSGELRRRMYEAEDAVFRRWLRPPFAADGWRVDVANMLGRQGASQIGPAITQAIRRAVKATRPDAYFMGENFFDASAQLQGDQFDAVMNYGGLARPLSFWLLGYRQGAHGFNGEIVSPVPYTTAAMTAAWRSRYAAIPWAIAVQQFNVLNSHDTPRLHTVTNGDVARQKLAAIIQFTYPGTPCLYYGDEIGLRDLPGLNSRGCMIWDESAWDHDLRDFYRQLIRLRRAAPALAHGGLQLLAAEADLVAYQRESAGQRALILANRGAARPAGPLPVAHGGIADGTEFREWFSGQTAVVSAGQLDLPALAPGGSCWLADVTFSS